MFNAKCRKMRRSLSSLNWASAARPTMIVEGDLNETGSPRVVQRRPAGTRTVDRDFSFQHRAGCENGLICTLRCGFKKRASDRSIDSAFRGRRLGCSIEKAAAAGNKCGRHFACDVVQHDFKVVIERTAIGLSELQPGRMTSG